MFSTSSAVHADFDFAGGDFGIVRALGALAHFAGDADDAFAAQRGGAFEKFLRADPTDQTPFACGLRGRGYR